MCEGKPDLLARRLSLLLSGVSHSLQHPRGSPPTGADVNLCALPVWPARHVPCVKHPLSLFSVKLLCDVRVEILCCALLLTFGRRTEEERGGSGEGGTHYSKPYPSLLPLIPVREFARFLLPRADEVCRGVVPLDIVGHVWTVEWQRVCE